MAYAGGGFFKGKRWLFVAARCRGFEGEVLFLPFGFSPVNWPECTWVSVSPGVFFVSTSSTTRDETSTVALGVSDLTDSDP